MIKKITRQNQAREGNALLIALLLTGILVLITISLAALITAETRQIGQMMNNGRAQYLAEAGSETSLFLIHQNRPGYEPTQDDETLILNIDEDKQFSVNIDSSTNHIPIVEDYVRDLVLDGGFLDKSELFDTLFLNQSITIPLQPGTQNFEFQYYLPIESTVPLQDWDILLWKLFGQNSEGNTDSMTEYLPAAKPIIGSEGGVNAINPAKFGTAPDGWQNGIYFDYSTGDTIVVEDATSQAEAESIAVDQNYIPISTFLSGHDNNYLVITNALNPAQINRAGLARGITLDEATRIQYRICTPNCAAVDEGRLSTENLVPKFTVIESSGLFGNSVKELRTSVNREGFLPVFDFAIYRTAN